MPAPLKITGTARFHKTRKKPQMPLLPGDAELLRQIENQREETRKSHQINEPLDYTGPLKNFRPPEAQGLKTMDICILIESIFNHMWADFPRNDRGNFALSGKVVAETAEYRETIPKVVTLSHLYGVFPTRTTQIDQAVSQACSSGLTRLVPTNSHDGSLDLLLLSSDFYDICDPLCPELGTLCRSKPDAVWFDHKDLINAYVDVPHAVSCGLLIVDPGKPGVHGLAIPSQGRFLKLLRQSRTWLLKTMVQSNKKFKEMPESQILDKFISGKRYWSQFRGVNLEWVLYDAIGSGYIDGFNTPVGRGWKVLKT